MAKFVYKLKPDTHDPRDLFYEPAKEKDHLKLERKVDLREWCSPVVDQGKLGSCTANAIASGLREYLLIKEGFEWVPLSRLFLYYEERKLEGTVDEDSGAAIRDGMKVLQSIGVCPEADDPYDITKFTESPSEEALADAGRYIINQYRRIKNLAMLKTALEEELPVVIGIYVYESFESDEVEATGIVPLPDKENEQLLGGHAVLAVGYDDENDWVIIRNSWGTGWGDAGYCYIPYAFWTNDLVMDMWTGTA